jgi:catalase
MSRLMVLMLACVAGASLATSSARADQEQVTPNAVVTALEEAYGVHPGERRNHTKGMCALGTFVGLPEAAIYSRSGLFSGSSLPVVARFSLAGGNPKASDAEKTPRGMALEFRLPDGSLQHMTMLDTPMFFAAIPKTFLDKMIALRPDPVTGKPNPEALKEFAASHPDNAGQATFLADDNPPPSYANSAYYGIHTFKFLNKDNQTTLVKWRFVPEDGEKELSDAELASSPPDFLEQALIDRTKQGPVRWDMLVTVGETGDPETDPTVAWPQGRKEIKAGTLTITEAMPQAGAPCEKINYDPLVMSDGIAATDDPVLLFRSPSYAVSYVKRLQGK